MSKHYFLVASLISLLFLGGVYLRGQERYENLVQSTSPFTPGLWQESVLDKGKSKGVLALDKAGHFLVLFEDTKGEWAPSRKILNEGTLFIAGMFLGEDPSEALPPISPYLQTQPGELVVGKILLRFRDGSLVVERNNEQKSTKVYAQDQEVEVFFGERTDPFVIPPGTRITVFDDKINRNTSQLYYSKLRKKSEFRLESFIDPEENRSNILEIREQIKRAHTLQQNFLKRLETFSTYKTKSWQLHRPGWFSGLKQFMTSLQQTFDFITLPKRKQVLALNQKAAHFLSAMNQLEEGHFEKAAKNFEAFKRVMASEDWSTFLEKSPLIKSEWEMIQKVQKALARYKSGEKYTVLNNFWFNTQEASPLNAFQQDFKRFQQYVTTRNYPKAITMLEPLLKTLENMIPPENHIDSTQATRYRRLVGESIGIHRYFQDHPSIYQLFKILSFKELSLYTQEEKREEIVLEIARDTLDFLSKQVNDETLQNESVMEMLQQLYKPLVSEPALNAEGGQSGQVLSGEQMSMVALMNKVGDKTISKADIDTLNARAQEVIPPAVVSTSPPEKEVAQRINSKKDLYSFFVVLGGSTAGLVFMPTHEVETFNFEQLYFNQKPISGTFNADSQTFQNIQIGDRFYDSLTPESFGKALYDKNFPGATSNTETQASPEKARERFEKLVLQKKLKNIDLNVSLEDMFVLSSQSDIITVQNSYSKNHPYQVHFNYYQTTEEVGEIRIILDGKSKRFDTKMAFPRFQVLVEKLATLSPSAQN